MADLETPGDFGIRVVDLWCSAPGDPEVAVVDAIRARDRQVRAAALLAAAQALEAECGDFAGSSPEVAALSRKLAMSTVKMLRAMAGALATGAPDGR